MASRPKRKRAYREAQRSRIVGVVTKINGIPLEPGVVMNVSWRPTGSRASRARFGAHGAAARG